MSTEDFNKLVEERCNKIVATLAAKQKEYSTADDKLHNFNRGASIAGQSRERVLHGFMLKHYISFMDIIDNVDKGIIPSDEVIDEKIGDIINYMILAEACLKERNQKK